MVCPSSQVAGGGSVAGLNPRSSRAPSTRTTSSHVATSAASSALLVGHRASFPSPPAKAPNPAVRGPDPVLLTPDLAPGDRRTRESSLQSWQRPRAPRPREEVGSPAAAIIVFPGFASGRSSSGEVEGRRGSGWRRRARLVTARAALGLSCTRAEIVRLSREEEQVKKINDTDTEGVKKPYTRKQAAIEGGFSYLNYVDHGITPSDDSEPFAKKARDYQEAMKRQHVEFDEATTKARFEHWMEEYGRSYDTEEEKARRYEIFKKVAVWADEVNAFEPRSVPFGPNGLADMTDEERELMDPHCGEFDWQLYTSITSTTWLLVGGST